MAITYNPNKHTASNKSYGVKGKPDGARTYYFDDGNTNRYRVFLSREEVIATFPVTDPQSRQGHFFAIVNTGGTVVDQVVTGGTNEIWWWKDGVSDADLVSFNSSVPSLADGVITPGEFNIDGAYLATFTVQFSYRLNGNVYDPVQNTLQLDAPDATYNRFDLVVGTDTGTYEKVTGVASASPLSPVAPTNTIVLAKIYRKPNGVNEIEIAGEAEYLPLSAGESKALQGDLYVGSGNNLIMKGSPSSKDSGDVIFMQGDGTISSRLFHFSYGSIEEERIIILFKEDFSKAFDVFHTGNYKTQMELTDSSPVQIDWQNDLIPGGSASMTWSAVRGNKIPTVTGSFFDADINRLRNYAPTVTYTVQTSDPSKIDQVYIDDVFEGTIVII